MYSISFTNQINISELNLQYIYIYIYLFNSMDLAGAIN